MVHGVLLRPLEYGDPDRIVALRQTDAQTGATDDVSVANFLDWQAASTSFGVEPTEPLAYAAVVALLAMVAIGAALVPAREATRIDPMDSIRVE